VLEQHLPLRRQLDLARAAQACDQPGADDALELRDLPADRRLAVPRASTRSAERSRRSDRLERSEVAKLDAVPRLHADCNDALR
jgi:hypothetical protein